MMRSSQLLRSVLLVGDALVFFLFAVLGQQQHHESSRIGESFLIALPFFSSWLLVESWYKIFPQPTLRTMLSRTAVVWLCAWPIGLALRWGIQHRGIPLSFDLVALCVVMAFLLTWHTLFFVAARKYAYEDQTLHSSMS